MSKRIAFALVLVLGAATAHADFDSLVRVVERQPGLHRVWIPGFFFVRLGVRMAHYDGVRDLELAVFEGRGDIDFEAALRSNPGTPMVRVHNNRTGETAVIWARPVGRDLMEMLVFSHDPGDETVVVRTVVDGEMLARAVADPQHASHIAR